jgi:hypothetical protein
MRERRSTPPPYRDAQVEARGITRDLLRYVGDGIDAALRRAVTELEALLNRLPDGTPDQRYAALKQSIHIIQAQQLRFRLALQRVTEEGRDSSFADVLDAWQAATDEAAKAVDVPDATLGSVLIPRTTMLAAYEGVGGAQNFRTLLTSAATDGYRRIDDVIRAAILKGQTFDALAKDLRQFVRGGDDGGGDLGQAFRTVRFNALRIGYSEIHNARAEAEVQHFALDPLVRAVAWRLSPDRGTLVGPDICDVLAVNNFYGLGAGIYPVTAVPFPPHPFDRCERVPIVRDISEIDEPKPNPGLEWPNHGLKVPRRNALSQGALGRLAEGTESLLRASVLHPAHQSLLRP